ncbi:tRNA uridine-5-carboxymethylaminomethyl(34) synthesis enzyme MnmG [SAR86 cluster bacterium]|nr:tRNA uridine-5-carboxymethylaminomethyl(34) synthesis enzyme MnmG [SAR86 cluster bacterium]
MKADVIVIGGGHAGCEAAAAAARIGVKTILITHKFATIGQMSCNPAIGGVGKSHLVKEIDAADGIMARCADMAAIHLKVLNSSKGPAVRATRAQADRELYKKSVQKELKNLENLEIVEGEVTDFGIQNNQIGSVTVGESKILKAQKVILTTGTFLNGKLFTGMDNNEGGRAGDNSSKKLAEKLRNIDFSVGRLKTGTPPRIHKDSINWEILEEQKGDVPRPTISFLSDQSIHPKQVPCFITRTNEKTHEIIMGDLDRSPMFSGKIEGVGPRYCPSIEDKIFRFKDKKSHQIFIEPEGLNSDLIYPNGISTSLPKDCQEKFVRSIEGFESAKITQYGYAVEYDFFDPRELHETLETRKIKNLYFAGQINGTTGYEEAAAQGLVAGANAALSFLGKDPWTPGREESYLGVLIDDLVTLGTKEPYRMFTSRSEHRLILREDNADQRITEKAYKVGLVSESRYKIFSEKKNKIIKEKDKLAKLFLRPEDKKIYSSLKIKEPKSATSFLDLLKRPDLDFQDLAKAFSIETPDNDIVFDIETNQRYSGYIKRQTDEIEKMKKNRNAHIPSNFDYSNVKGLSAEITQKLSKVEPKTLAQAWRIPGITPAAISALMVYLKRNETETADKNARGSIREP